jgi:hypothetical protein
MHIARSRGLAVSALLLAAACEPGGGDDVEYTPGSGSSSGSGSNSCYDGASSAGGIGLLFGYIYCSAYPGVYAAPQMALPPGALVAYDLATEERTVVTGDGPPLVYPVAIALDATGETAYVADAGLEAILAVDLATGTRSVVSGAGRGTGPALAMPTALLLDEGRLVVIRYAGERALAVDPLTGDRALGTIGLVPPAEPMRVLDGPRDRVLVVEPIGS